MVVVLFVHNIFLGVDGLPAIVVEDENVGEGGAMGFLAGVGEDDETIHYGGIVIDADDQAIKANIPIGRRKMAGEPGNVLGFVDHLAARDDVNELGSEDAVEGSGVASMQPLVFEREQGFGVRRRAARESSSGKGDQEQGEEYA